MRWILLDLAVALAALAVLAVLVLGLWRKVKALSATVREAGERIERATDALTTAQLGAGLADHPAADHPAADHPAADHPAARPAARGGRPAATVAPGSRGRRPAAAVAPGARGGAGRGR